MIETWATRAARARALAADDPSTAALLTFYARVLEAQGQVYDGLRNGRAEALPRQDSTEPLPRRQAARAGEALALCGSLDADLARVRSHAPALLRVVSAHGPDALAQDARRLLEDASALDAALLEYWRSPGDRQFFAKALLQPYAQALADLQVKPGGRDVSSSPHRCPWCGGAPQLSVLRATAGGEGSGRALLCASCLTTWPSRRVWCASCGETDEHRLSYFHAPAFDHLRVDACDTCRRYLKAVDLTRLGLAVPLVDEVAGAPLDLWAGEHGYEKIELNLLGL